MPGHNHYSDCTCGWCLKLGGGHATKVLYASGVRTANFASYLSFTTPNASCPVCGATVFFYQSPNGGRVFFDELGPPWPKHPCTDNSQAMPVTKLTTAPPRPTPIWRKQDWEPIRIRSQRMEGGWYLVEIVNVITGLYFDVLTDQVLGLAGETCAFMKAWDSHGWSVISYVELDGSAEEILVPIFEKKRYAGTSRMNAVDHRKRNTSP